MFGLSLAEIHAAMVHVPIVLLPLGVVVDLYRFTRWGSPVKLAGLYTLALGWLGAGAAVISGWQVQGNVRGSSGAASLLFWHRLNGLVIVGMFALLLSFRLAPLSRASGWREWRYLAQGRNLSGRARVAYAVLAVVGLALVLIQGYLGGHMVYHFGVL